MPAGPLCILSYSLAAGHAGQSPAVTLFRAGVAV
jgi:hypothetical protein